MLTVFALGAALTMPQTFEGFRKQVDDWVLSGESLPADYILRLGPLPPDQRLMAIAYLRRAGLLDGPGPGLDTLLAPVQTPQTEPDP